jgi:hypothetical protein
MTCLNVGTAAVMLNVAVCPIVSVGMARDDALGMVVSVHEPSSDIGPAPAGLRLMSMDAEHATVLVPSLS